MTAGTGAQTATGATACHTPSEGYSSGIVQDGENPKAIPDNIHRISVGIT
jgi:hypothetical protein